ncbi:MAG: hypothetical protein ACJAR3_001600 [Roseivirga sp.]|jgi:hypothetical protein
MTLGEKKQLKLSILHRPNKIIEAGIAVAVGTKKRRAFGKALLFLLYVNIGH